MADIETRFGSQIDASTTGRTVTWRPIVFNQRSEPLGGGAFVEVISPGAVTKTLAENRNVVADFQHELGIVLGTTRAGTLRLRAGPGGITAEVDVPTSRADVLELIRRGDVSAGSFSFEMVAERWENGSPPVRRIEQLRLHGVSLLASQPAYPATTNTVSVRALERAQGMRPKYTGELLGRLDRLERDSGLSPAEAGRRLDVLEAGAPTRRRRL